MLDREHKWLRDDRRGDDEERAEFWEKFDPAQIAEDEARRRSTPKVRRGELRGRYRKALERARPDGGVELAVLRAHGRHRQPRPAALLRRRPVAGRPDRARGEGDGSAPAGRWRTAARTGCAATRSRRARIAVARSDLSAARPRAGAPAFAERLQDRGRSRRTTGKKAKARTQKAQGRRRGRADQCDDAACDGPRARGDPSRRPRKAARSRRISKRRKDGLAARGGAARSAAAVARRTARTWKDRAARREGRDSRRRLIRSIKKLHCCGGARMRQSSAEQGRNAMPRPSVADKRRHIPQAARIRLLRDPQSVGRRLGALPAGARLQGAGLDLVGLCVVGGACRQRGRRRHGAGASEGDLSTRPTCR